MKKLRNENITKFYDDYVVKLYKTCGYGAPQTDTELRSAFYNAVSETCPELKTCNRKFCFSVRSRAKKVEPN